MAEETQKMTRIAGGDVTETLIRSTEAASEIEADHCLVILYRKHGGHSLRCIASDEVTIETANWMLDKMKIFLMVE